MAHTTGPSLADQHHGALALFHEPLDERPPEPSGHVPVDRPRVIPLGILTYVGKLDTHATERGSVTARQDVGQQSGRADLHTAHLRQNLTEPFFWLGRRF